MRKSTLIFLIYLLFNLLSLLPHVVSISTCNETCRNMNDCDGRLICIDGKCNDDPTEMANRCQGCSPSGSLMCNGSTYPTYSCSPAITSSTPAKLTNNNFSQGGDSGGPSECDGKYHSNKNLIVALSTGWYNGGTRCNQVIHIQADNGRSVKAKVVGECNSRHGCDEKHPGKPRCDYDVVAASDAVWEALELDIDVGVFTVTWSMAIEERKSPVLILSCPF